MVSEEALAMEKMRKLCAETSIFRKDYYQKIKHGWLSMLPMDDVKMVHFLYRIFYMAPSDQDVQLFEWHNFFDTFHDFPMRAHSDDTDDMKMCATMADIVAWFKKTDLERKGLRRIGKVPKVIYCLGCKTDDEKEFAKKTSFRKVEIKEESIPHVQTVSIKAAKLLGMSVLETADVAITSNQLQQLLTINNIALPLRRSTSSLLYPVTEGVEQHYSKDLNNRREQIAVSIGHRKLALAEIMEQEESEEEGSSEKDFTKVKHFPTTLVVGENGLPHVEKNQPVRKNGVVGFPRIKRNDPLRDSIVKRMNYERLLMASEWVRIDDEVKMTLVEIKIRQRILLIDNYINGWSKDRSKDTILTKWLFDDTNSPLHTRQFANFEYYHFIPSHAHSILTQLDQRMLIKYSKKHEDLGSAPEPKPWTVFKYPVLCEPRVDNDTSEVYL